MFSVVAGRSVGIRPTIGTQERVYQGACVRIMKHRIVVLAVATSSLLTALPSCRSFSPVPTTLRPAAPLLTQNNNNNKHATTTTTTVIPPSSSRKPDCSLYSLRPVSPLSLWKEPREADSRFPTRRFSLANDNKNNNPQSGADADGPLVLVGLALVSFLYWYWMVFGAAAAVNGWPGVPAFVPLVPGWPPSVEDLQPTLDDAYHFFYLSELLGQEAPYAPATRLAVFNLAEAWIFAVLPVLWQDPRRLPRPVLASLWAVLGINLTNAFLAPYLFTTAVLGTPTETTTTTTTTTTRPKNRVVATAIGGIAAAVVSFALYETVTATTMDDWSLFVQECQQDRTYFAFVVDLCLFSIFQPYVLKRAKGSNDTLDYVPWVGLIAHLMKP